MAMILPVSTRKGTYFRGEVTVKGTIKKKKMFLTIKEAREWCNKTTKELRGEKKTKLTKYGKYTVKEPDRKFAQRNKIMLPSFDLLNAKEVKHILSKKDHRYNEVIYYATLLIFSTCCSQTKLGLLEWDDINIIDKRANDVNVSLPGNYRSYSRITKLPGHVAKQFIELKERYVKSQKSPREENKKVFTQEFFNTLDIDFTKLIRKVLFFGLSGDYSYNMINNTLMYYLIKLGWPNKTIKKFFGVKIDTHLKSLRKEIINFNHHDQGLVDTLNDFYNRTIE